MTKPAAGALHGGTEGAPSSCQISQISAVSSRFRNATMRFVSCARVALAVFPLSCVALVEQTKGAMYRLLLQRSVQTQVVYLTDFHDEVKATWLCEFGAPAAPMGTVRLSNTECLPKYHGLDAFNDVDLPTYMRSMLDEAPFTYKVRYKVGTPPGAGAHEGDGFGTGAAHDGGGAFGSNEEEAAAAFASGMDMWGGSNGAAAAASRRRNPHLDRSAKYIEYDETVVPSRTAQLLFQTQSQIAHEWSRDLLAVAAGAIEPDLPPEGEAQTEEDRLGRIQSAYARVARDNALSDGFGSSPLRAANLDLCERLATREAALLVLQERSLPPAAAERLRAKLEFSQADVEPDDDDDDDDDDEVLALNRALKRRAKDFVRVDALGGHARRRGLARRWLETLEASPEAADAAIASLVRRKRAEVARYWANSCVEDLAADHALLLREVLEKQLRTGPTDVNPYGQR